MTQRTTPNEPAYSPDGISAAAVARPRLAFGTWAFAFGPFEPNPWSFSDICAYASDAGYDGVEINGFRPHPHDEDIRSDSEIAAVRDILDANALGVSAYAPDFRSTPPADVPLETYLERVESTLVFSQKIGTEILRTDTISAPGPMDRERFDRLVAAWNAAAGRAADRGIRLVWEFEPGFWLNRPSQVVRLLDAVDHPNFSILFDTSHAYTGAVAGARQGENPELLSGGVREYAELLRERIGHLHFIDSDGSLHDEDTSAHLPFGSGLIDFDDALSGIAGVADALPWWTVDFCFCETTEKDGRLAVPFMRDLIARNHRAATGATA